MSIDGTAFENVGRKGTSRSISLGQSPQLATAWSGRADDSLIVSTVHAAECSGKFNAEMIGTSRP
jgi:hypothetical protein